MAIFVSITGLLLVGAVVGMEKADTIPMHQKEKRAVRCLPKFKSIPGHSACLPKSPRAISKGVTEADKRTIVYEHNKWRQQVSPPASDMLKMEWDDELAMIAQKYTDTCPRGHEPQFKQRSIPGRFRWVGQNIAWRVQNFEQAIGVWHDQHKHFNYGSTSSSRKIRLYTQVIWAKTKLVGCGFSICDGKTYHFCNYAPGGNDQGHVAKPYEAGPSASACPRYARGGLCDCPPCENGAKRNLSTCKCSCASSYYFGKMCENINCNKANLEKKTEICSYAKKKSPTPCKYSNIPASCPWDCGVCPAPERSSLAFGNAKNSPTTVGRRQPTLSTISADSVKASNGKLSPHWTIWIPLFLPFTIVN